jgi:hypothetical protein
MEVSKAVSCPNASSTEIGAYQQETPVQGSPVDDWRLTGRRALAPAPDRYRRFRAIKSDKFSLAAEIDNGRLTVAVKTEMAGASRPLSGRLLALGHDRRFALASRAAAQRGSHAEHCDSGHHNDDKLSHVNPLCLDAPMFRNRH